MTKVDKASKVDKAKTFIGNMLNDLESKGYGPEVALIRSMFQFSAINNSDWEKMYDEIQVQFPEMKGL